MSDLVEKVARLICETENVEGFKCTCPIPFEPDWCHGNRAKAQARAVIAAVADWLNEHHKQLWLGSENHASPALREQLEAKGTHGTPELDEDARKLAALGQDPGMTLEELLAPDADPAPAVCEWTRTPYTALYSSCCDEDYLRNVTDSGMCHRCGLPIKFAEAKE